MQFGQDGARIFIGFDQAESVAWSVFNYSIQRRASRPVQVAPIMLSQLRENIYRDWDPKQSNEFAFSRWLVPYLCDYEGWALWADCDILCLRDIYDLWALRDPKYAIQVVKHPPLTVRSSKYLGRPQTAYARKNWSSVILFNCARCHALTPEYINQAPGLSLHQFDWVADQLIGGLPREWNYLVGYYPPIGCPSFIHYTDGGPWFREYHDVDYAERWRREFYLMTHSDQRT